MRLLLLAAFVCGFAENGAAQCLVLPRQASVDPDAKNVAIRYYNSSTRAVKAVEFTLTKPGSGPDKRETLAHYSAKETLREKHETTAVFRRATGNSELSEAAQNGSLEVEVTRVVFADYSTWRPSSNNACKISLSVH